MKKFLLLTPAMLLSITLSATLYEKDSIQQAIDMQGGDQVSACMGKKEGSVCEYQKINCSPILIRGAQNRCTSIGTITGRCHETKYADNTILECQEDTKENK